MLRPLIAMTVVAFASAAGAQTTPASTDTQRVVPKLLSTLTGDWGGLRSDLRDDGVDLTASYGSESGTNVSGGQRERVTETGQFIFGATLDTEKLFGLKGGTFQATITYRRGDDLDRVAGLGALQQVQEVYGRGQTVRLTELWYDQVFAGGHADLKLGRLTQGEDFGSFSCQFMNLTFCGAPPGNLVGDYWYNWPISQWGVRLRIKRDNGFYAMIGAYEINRRNLDTDFFIGQFHGATGVMVPIELGYNMGLGAARLPGSYKLGGWYNTSDSNDVGLNVDRQPLVVNGLAPLRRSARYGAYLQLQQQFSGTATVGPTGPVATHGLVAFLNVTQTDRETSTTDNQVAAGMFYTGLFAVRPKDDFGLAIGRTNFNSRVAITLAPPGSARPDAEYAAEIAYGVHAADWLIVRPNVQYVVDPGGLRDAHDVVILGVKGNVTF